jgi:hypothetical protein
MIDITSLVDERMKGDEIRLPVCRHTIPVVGCDIIKDNEQSVIGLIRRGGACFEGSWHDSIRATLILDTTIKRS